MDPREPFYEHHMFTQLMLTYVCIQRHISWKEDLHRSVYVRLERTILYFTLFIVFYICKNAPLILHKLFRQSHIIIQ